jgi:hypothetical protein
MCKLVLGANGEPTIEELVEDPIAHFLRRRDGIGKEDVWTVVEQARAALRRQKAARECAEEAAF